MTLNIASRNDVGELFCKGEGLEIGAGCLPTSVAKGSVVHFVDKRTPDELRTYFSTNDIVNVQSLSVFEGQIFDFVIAHHVLEHSANVIQTLVHWMSFIKNGGILFFSLPNRHITPDASRLLTPPTHFLLDYVYQATEDDYESREHICSFLWGWIDVGGLKDKSKLESAESVAKSLNSDVNDLHWHTFNIDTMKFVVQMAANFSGRSIEVMFEQDGFSALSEHRLVCKLNQSAASISPNVSKLLEIQSSLRSVVYNASLETLTGNVTYSLSKEHKGKLFLVDRSKVHWIRTPQFLEDNSLQGIDYTYLEIAETERELIGGEIGNANPDRRAPICSRLLDLDKEPGIELSPGSSPLLDKFAFNVTYVDKFDHHANSDTYLQGKPVLIDVVLGNKLIDEALDHNAYCYLVSSHVIEHVPDFIQFFKSAAKVLKDGARLIMYVPDKRYTFDVLRPISTILDIEKAYIQRLRHPSREMALEWYVNADFKANTLALWNKSYTAVPSYSVSEALKITDGIILENEDLHCFTFTPESFCLLINYVISKYVPCFKLIEITDTPSGQNEFIVDLVVSK